MLFDEVDKLIEGGKQSIKWMFPYTPNTDAWRAEVVSALAAYSAGEQDFEVVRKAIVDGWAKQYTASQGQ